MPEPSIEVTEKLFFPYYINQGRLLDIYAILNGGYSEYVEITTAVNSETKSSGKAGITANGGFKILDLGTSLTAGKDNVASNSNENREKKVQTVTSMLHIVINALNSRGYLHDITLANVGMFVCTPVCLQINSIRALLSETQELLKLMENIDRISGSSGTSSKKDSSKALRNTPKSDSKDIKEVMQLLQTIFSGEEIIYETESYAIFGNISNENLYQAIRSDIIGTNLMCLAQVKRIYPDGTDLMRNTIFSKIQDTAAKESLINSMKSLTENDAFTFESAAISSIHGKPVYELEIVALYQ